MGEKEKIPLVHSGHFVCGDLRKYAERLGNVIQWGQSNRAHILTHGVSAMGLSWSAVSRVMDIPYNTLLAAKARRAEKEN